MCKVPSIKVHERKLFFLAIGFIRNVKLLTLHAKNENRISQNKKPKKSNYEKSTKNLTEAQSIRNFVSK